ncbi:MAG: hypothetical protein M3063_11470 [Actinomycetota bacterium]|nr:hypothetical protein [Actinomycetota bacterium]
MVTKATPTRSTRATAAQARPNDVKTSAAADAAVDENVTKVRLPCVGTLSLPPLDHLAWYGGVAALTALELIEWPVALVLTVGKALADNRSHRTLRSLGDALEQAG